MLNYYSHLYNTENIHEYFPHLYNRFSSEKVKLTEEQTKVIVTKFLGQNYKSDKNSSPRTELTGKCPAGQYSASFGRCKNCESGCRTCKKFLWRSVCSTCFDRNATLRGGVCHCKNGPVFSTDNKTCCSAYCAKCTSNKKLNSSTCDTCN
mgnify:CR=1 FL=1